MITICFSHISAFLYLLYARVLTVIIVWLCVIVQKTNLDTGCCSSSSTNVTSSKAGIDWKVGDDEESEVECKSTLGDGDTEVECKNTLGDGEGVIAKKADYFLWVYCAPALYLYVSCGIFIIDVREERYSCYNFNSTIIIY
jgi:hypothetical protein